MRHIIISIIAVFIIIGVPVCLSGYPKRAMSGEDAISKATVIVEKPSGAYSVFINTSLHLNEENLAVWKDFFEGKDIDFVFEDISCIVLDTDESGKAILESFVSRLPENQLSARVEDATLALSKAYYGKIDMLLVSEEAGKAYGTFKLEKLSFLECVKGTSDYAKN